jgi:hypothetical protein
MGEANTQTVRLSRKRSRPVRGSCRRSQSSALAASCFGLVAIGAAGILLCSPLWSPIAGSAHIGCQCADLRKTQAAVRSIFSRPRRFRMSMNVLVIMPTEGSFSSSGAAKSQNLGGLPVS